MPPNASRLVWQILTPRPHHTSKFLLDDVECWNDTIEKTKFYYIFDNSIYYGKTKNHRLWPFQACRQQFPPQYAQNATPNQVGMAMMRLSSPARPKWHKPSALVAYSQASLRKRLRISEVNTELVRRHENKICCKQCIFRPHHLPQQTLYVPYCQWS